MTSFEILKNDNYSIELLEKCENITCRDELRAREGHFIRDIDCVNRCIAGRSKKQYSQDERELHRGCERRYYHANKEAIRERKRRYLEANKEAIKERQRKYREDNREVCLKRQRDYYHANREAIMEQRRQRKAANAEAAKTEVETPKPNQDPLIEQKREWKQERIRCETCGATVTKGAYSNHKKAKYCLEAAAAKAAQDDSDL
jgi:hypothetical protein